LVYKVIIKPLLFCLDAEKAHHLTSSLFGILLKIPIIKKLVERSFRYDDPSLERELWGLRFPNPVGLAAGFDKDGKYFRNMAKLGFGFVEIGTVTPRPQEGNLKKRLFRLPKDKSLINRMGFNNEGVDKLVHRLRKINDSKLIIGGNIGKNKLTANTEALEDYRICFEKLYPYVDYFVLNVSSPNTPGLRELQEKKPLTRLLRTLIQLRNEKHKYKPVLLKIAPDLSESQLDDILDIIERESVDGIIATNTTIDRKGLATPDATIQKIGNGGLSGKAISNKSLEMVRMIRSKKADLPIIGVGGISSPEDAKKMMDAGANLVQVYSGLVFEGPSFIKKIKKHLAR
jgi:dihydroorotate dehydrogenase